VDLRLQFTGINRLTISSNNNFSFADAKGNADERIQSISITGIRPLLATESENWFALYNTLSINYQLTSKLTAALQAVNSYGKYYIENNGNNETVITNTLGITSFIAYQFNESIFVQAGLQFYIDWYNYQSVPVNNNINGNMVYFAVPLRFRINF